MNDSLRRQIVYIITYLKLLHGKIMEKNSVDFFSRFHQDELFHDLFLTMICKIGVRCSLVGSDLVCDERTNKIRLKK